MSKFVFLFRGGAFVEPNLSPTELQNHLKKWHEWIAGLMKAGQTHPGGNPLERSGTTLRGRDRTTTDGPYAESKDLVTGSLVVEAPSLAAATELARGCPIFEFDGSVEVRPPSKPPIGAASSTCTMRWRRSCLVPSLRSTVPSHSPSVTGRRRDVAR